MGKKSKNSVDIFITDSPGCATEMTTTKSAVLQYIFFNVKILKNLKN